MRLEDVGPAGRRTTTTGRLALTLGLLGCLLMALAPAAANAAPSLSAASGFPASSILGASGVSGNIVVSNGDAAATICNASFPECGSDIGITLLPSCSQTQQLTCSALGTDLGVFTIPGPTATGSGSGCPGQTFNVSTGFDSVGTVRFTPTPTALVMPAGSVCTITFTYSVDDVPVDAQAGVTGLQTRQRAVASASSGGEYIASTGGAGVATVVLPAPTGISVDPASPANNNSPKVKGVANAAATQVTVYDQAGCTGASVTGTVAAFNAAGITFGVLDGSTSVFSARVSDSGGGVSACSSSVTYVEDSTPPPVPALTSTVPGSPSNSNLPNIKGTAAAGSTVRIYTDATCSASVLVSGTPAEFASPGLAVPAGTPIPSNATTTFRATTVDAAGNESACSPGLAYVEDSVAPARPTPTGTNPASPFNDNTPRIVGTADADATVTLYTTSDCSGSSVGSGSAATFASGGIEATVADNSTTIFYVRASDQATNLSTCSVGVTYVEDSLPPSGAVLTGSSPASPSNQNSPRIKGTAPAGTTVRLYTDPVCAGSVAGEGTAAAFESPGIEVNVPSNATTTFYARSVDAASNQSGCSSTSVTYVEDSVAPQTTVDSGPSGSGAPATPTFTFSSTDPGVTFECRLDSGAFAACTSPFTTPTLGEGAHTFEVRARDSAGNVGASIVRAFTVGGAVTPPPPPPPPPASVPPPPPPPPPPARPVARAQPGCLGIKGTAYVGTSGRNVRNGGPATDIMFGLGGNDSLRGAAGLDCLYGGPGNDALQGGAGADRLFGEAGDDRLEGQAGNDRLSGSGGNDRLNGGTGNDRNTAGAGRDTLTDRSGTDRFSGGSGADRIDARDTKPADRRKRDQILCGAGVDRVLADPRDIVARDCEKRNVIRRSLR